MKQICFIFATVVASVSCYDLMTGDRLFELPLNRFKRATERPPHCCGNDFSTYPVVVFGKITPECEPKTALNYDDVKLLLNAIMCVGDCVAQKAGMVLDDEVDREKVLEYFKSNDKDKYRIQKYEENLDKCISQAKEVQEKLEGKVKCSSMPATLLNCLYWETLVNCPEDKQNEKKQKICANIRDKGYITYDEIFLE